ncbi:MAG TPA: DNA topoisomerase IB [Vicinamibacteria bacterium]
MTTVPPDAAAAGLRYVSDAKPGIRRLRRGRGFRYVGADGAAVRDPVVLARIKKLAIPPAWTEVWICPLAHGHLQASGRDSKRRKQYRYHTRWREVRDEAKYGRMVAFARALGRIRARTARDLARPGLPREKVLATVVRLLEATHIRVGNEEYARQNRSYGLTTLRDSHASVSGAKLEFRFRGKGGKEHVVGIQDRRLSRIVKRCQELPGYELFQYLDEAGERRGIESADVNAYLREVSGEDFTAKDFRTWAGTVLAAWELCEMEAGLSERRAKRNVAQAIEAVSERLGNTPAICRKCYVHPTVIESYLDGSLARTLRRRAAAMREAGLRPEESMVLALLSSAKRQKGRRAA